MDELATPAPQPQPHRRIVFIAGLIVILIVVILIVLYFLFASGYLSKGKNPGFTVVWATGTATSSEWFVADTPTNVVAHAAPAGTTISGIATGGGRFFLTANSAQGGALYEYTGTSYVPIATTTATIGGLSVSNTGDLAAFTETVASTTNVVVVSVATKKSTPLGVGFSPVLLHNAGVDSILYLSGTSILGQSLIGTWTTPATIYTAMSAFTPASQIATDGLSQFAFTDPAVHTTQTWKLTIVNPITASPVSIATSSSPVSSLAFIKGALGSIMPTKAETNAKPPASVEVLLITTGGNRTPYIIGPAASTTLEFFGSLSS